MHIINGWPNTALKVVSKAQIPANQWVHVAVTYDGSRKASGLHIYINGVAQEKNIENDKLDASTIQLRRCFALASDRMRLHSPVRFRI